MAGRIRSIKPELLDDEIVAELSDAAWRLFVSSWLLADDYGCFRAGPRYLAAQVWQDTRRDALTPLLELADRGRVLLYEVEGQPYAVIPTWDRHQRVDNAGKRRVPAPPTNIREVSHRFAEFLRESPRVSASLGNSPLGPKESPLDLRPPTSDPDQDQERNVRSKAAPPSGAGPSSVQTLDPEPLAEDEATALPARDPAPFEATPEAPEPWPATAQEQPDESQSLPMPASRSPEPVLDQPEPRASPPPDERATPAPTAPALPGPVAAARASSDPGQAPLLLALVPTRPTKPDPVEEIFAEYVAGWKRATKGRRAPKLDDKRRRLTHARLREFCEDDLKAAARGIWACEWNVENKQTDYDLVMRDAAHVEKFMAFDEAARPVPSDAPRVPEWLSDAARPSPRVQAALRDKEALAKIASDPRDIAARIADIGSMEFDQ